MVLVYIVMASQEFLKREFIHHISDTIALLSGNEEIVDKLRQVEEKPLTPEIIEDIRKFNAEQITKAKTSLALLNTISVTKD